MKHYLENILNMIKKIRGNGIIKDGVYLREMFSWNKEYEKKFYKNNIEYLLQCLNPFKDASKYLKKLMDEGNEIYIITGRG